MPRNISFFLTTDQIRNRTKTVTRRAGWKNLKAGEILNACVKCQGLKKGEAIERICQIRVKDVRREALNEMDESRYGDEEARLEGFPSMTGTEFVTMFLDNIGGLSDQDVTRIEFEYIDK